MVFYCKCCVAVCMRSRYKLEPLLTLRKDFLFGMECEGCDYCQTWDPSRLQISSFKGQTCDWATTTWKERNWANIWGFGRSVAVKNRLKVKICVKVALVSVMIRYVLYREEINVFAPRIYYQRDCYGRDMLLSNYLRWEEIAVSALFVKVGQDCWKHRRRRRTVTQFNFGFRVSRSSSSGRMGSSRK